MAMTEEECKKLEDDNAALRAELNELKARMAQSAAEAEKKAKAEGEDPAEPDEDEDEPEAKSASAQVVALAQQLTGCKDLEALPGALMALGTRATGTTSAKAKHVERVTKAIEEGKLAPARKAWALAATPKAFDAYLQGIGDNVIAPVGLEHKQASEAEAKSRQGLDPSAVTLTDQELKLAKEFKVTPEALLNTKRKQLGLAS